MKKYKNHIPLWLKPMLWGTGKRRSILWLNFAAGVLLTGIGLTGIVGLRGFLQRMSFEMFLVSAVLLGISGFVGLYFMAASQELLTKYTLDNN